MHYMHTRTHTHTHTHAHTHARAHAHTRTHTHTCTHAHMHTCTHTHTHTHMHMRTHMHTHAHTHTHTHTHTRTHARTHTHTHTHMHTHHTLHTPSRIPYVHVQSKHNYYLSCYEAVLFTYKEFYFVRTSYFYCILNGDVFVIIQTNCPPQLNTLCCVHCSLCQQLALKYCNFQ